MYYSNEEFNAWLEKESPVEWRREEFNKKLQEYLNRPDLSGILVKDGKTNFPFIIVGMTIEGQILSGIGFHAFVANGYPPAGLGFAARNKEGVPTAKFVFTVCCAVKKKADTYYLEPILNDEEVLDKEKVKSLFDDIIKKTYCGCSQYGIELCKFNLKDNPIQLFAWIQPFINKNGSFCYLLADADNACIYVIPEKDRESYRIIDDTRDRVCSLYSAYLFNGGRLIREEYQRTGGWGQFHG